MILGSAPFIKNALNGVADAIEKKETAQRRVLSSKATGIDEIVRFLAHYFNVTEETIVNTSPYRSYAIFLARKHSPVSSTEIGRYFGGITCSAVTKTGTRMRLRMEKDKALKEEMSKIEEHLSFVNG